MRPSGAGGARGAGPRRQDTLCAGARHHVMYRRGCCEHLRDVSNYSSYIIRLPKKYVSVRLNSCSSSNMVNVCIFGINLS